VTIMAAESRADVGRGGRQAMTVQRRRPMDWDDMRLHGTVWRTGRGLMQYARKEGDGGCGRRR
jgi:hypothetical protein